MRLISDRRRVDAPDFGQKKGRSVGFWFVARVGLLPNQEFMTWKQPTYGRITSRVRCNAIPKKFEFINYGVSINRGRMVTQRWVNAATGLYQTFPMGYSLGIHQQRYNCGLENIVVCSLVCPVIDRFPYLICTNFLLEIY